MSYTPDLIKFLQGKRINKNIDICGLPCCKSGLYECITMQWSNIYQFISKGCCNKAKPLMKVKSIKMVKKCTYVSYQTVRKTVQQAKWHDHQSFTEMWSWNWLTIFLNVIPAAPMSSLVLAIGVCNRISENM